MPRAVRLTPGPRGRALPLFLRRWPLGSGWGWTHRCSEPLVVRSPTNGVREDLVCVLKLAEEGGRSTPIRVIGLAQSAVRRPDLFSRSVWRHSEKVVQRVACHQETVP